MGLKAGARIGAYDIVGSLGAGGMGEVYRARDTKLNREVALKILPETFASDPDRVVRFSREAQAVAALNHPNVVTIYSVEEAQGIHFLTMECIEGPVLAQLIGPKGVAWPDFFKWSIALADAVSAAHQQGIIHRDLKPANIMIGGGARLKVLDFGIAKLQQDVHGARHVGLAATEQVTGPHQVIGTAAYMSPEQGEGKPLDARSDIFSLGVVLYEMATGGRPFKGETGLAVLASIMKDPAPLLSDARVDAPRDLDRILRRCLAKEPERRYQTAVDVRNELEDLQMEVSAIAPSDRSAGGGVTAPNAVDLEQEIRFCTAPDGVRLAYSMIGQGPPLIRTGNWMTHLEFDLESPVWRHLYRALAKNYTLIRYDARGSGLSDRSVDEISFDAFVSDLEAVVDATGIRRFALLGISQGCAISIAYAVRHPERVSHLILYGGFALGWNTRARTAAQKEEDAAMMTLMRLGWGKENAAFRQLFTSQFIPGGTKEQADWFNDLQRITVSGEVAARMFEATGEFDVTALLPRVSVSTLVLHAREDARVPFEAGRRMAAAIPGARFVTLTGRNHLFLETERAFAQFLEHTRTFHAT